ncbi:MAG: histidine triad nucleotide-binding protein [Spirochaetales bacterium]|jgi:histidine triad (HIT) family protein|nr:histidine triad nucleotide-binding protein [Spirochaetales bacterium]
MADDDTIFDKILRGEIPCDRVYEDEWVLCFRDINPQAPVHAVVIPKKKARDVGELCALAPDFVGGYMAGIVKAAQRLGLEGGYRVVFNTGKDAQQSVAYVHAHILGGRVLGWPPG